MLLDGQAGEDHDAVLAAVEIHGAAEDGVHAGEFSEFRGLIDVAGAERVDVHFLERDEIGIELLDQGGDSREIDLLVHPDAVMDVVGHHGQLHRLPYACCASDGQHRSHQRAKSSERSHGEAA